MAKPAERTQDTGPAATTPPLAAYDRDFYTWSQEQAALMRAGRFDRLDVENVAEELESLGKEQFNKLESAYRVLLMHMLKWDYQPARRSRSWANTIASQRDEASDVVGDNPGLKPRIGEALQRAYRKARLDASSETGLNPRLFPTALPYTPDEIMTRPFEWPEP
jgi:hypothetical protein